MFGVDWVIMRYENDNINKFLDDKKITPSEYNILFCDKKNWSSSSKKLKLFNKTLQKIIDLQKEKQILLLNSIIFFKLSKEQLPLEKNINIYFLEAEFFGKTNFSDIDIIPRISFRDAKFFGKVTFENSKFFARVSFANTLFYNTINFKNIEFKKEAFFRDAHFKQDTYFVGAKFENEAIFRNTKFLQNTTFKDAKFSNYANFIKSSFKENIYFTRAKFLGITSFLTSSFSKSSNFKNANFFGKTHFKESYFENEVKFEKCLFFNHVDFSEITFNADTYFNQAEFYTFVTFENSECHDGTFNLNNTKFHKILLDNGSFSHPNFLKLLGKENYKDIVLNSNNFATKESARIIKSHFEKQDNITEANKYFTIEQDLYIDELKKDKREPNRLSNLTVLYLNKGVSNFGTNWIRSLLFLFTLSYLFMRLYIDLDEYLGTDKHIKDFTQVSDIQFTWSMFVSWGLIYLSTFFKSEKLTFWILLSLGIITGLTAIGLYDNVLAMQNYIIQLTNPINAFKNMNLYEGIELYGAIVRITVVTIMYQFIVAFRQNTRRK